VSNAMQEIRNMVSIKWCQMRSLNRSRGLGKINRLLHQMLGINQLTRSSHACAGHHGHILHAAEALSHAPRKITVLGVWGCFFEGG
jgi:hypothetical protein